jgi:hypothetical protein
MNTEYDKKIEELKQKIQELQKEKEETKKLADKAAWKAKPPKEKAEDMWKEAHNKILRAEKYYEDNRHDADYDYTTYLEITMEFRDLAREAVKYEQEAKKEEKNHENT